MAESRRKFDQDFREGAVRRQATARSSTSGCCQAWWMTTAPWPSAPLPADALAEVTGYSPAHREPAGVSGSTIMITACRHRRVGRTF